MVPAGGSGGWRSSQRYEMRFMKLTPESFCLVKFRHWYTLRKVPKYRWCFSSQFPMCFLFRWWHFDGRDLYTILADLSGWNGGLIWFKSGVPGPIPDMEAWTAKFHNFHGESVVTRAEMMWNRAEGTSKKYARKGRAGFWGRKDAARRSGFKFVRVTCLEV